MSKGVVGISIPCTKGYSYRGTRPRPVKEHFNYLLYKQFFGTSRNTVLTPFIFSTHTNTDKLYQYLWHFMCLICEPCWHQVNADRQLIKEPDVLGTTDANRKYFCSMKATAHVKTFLSCGHKLQNANSQVETRGSNSGFFEDDIRHT